MRFILCRVYVLRTYVGWSWVHLYPFQKGSRNILRRLAARKTFRINQTLGGFYACRSILIYRQFLEKGTINY